MNGNQQQAKLTHTQFFRFCEELRRIKPTIETQNYTKQKTAEVIGGNLGFEISKHAFANARKVLGNDYPRFKTKPGTTGIASTKNRLERAVRAIRAIADKLGDKDLSQEISDIFSGR